MRFDKGKRKEVNKQYRHYQRKKTTLTYDGETIDFDYYVLDSISKKTNLTKMNYEHGDTIDFSGGQLTATYKDSSGNTLEDTLNIASEIATGEITVDKTKADVDNKKVTFTYKSLTTDMTLTVTDPVSSISITKQPTFNIKFNIQHSTFNIKFNTQHSTLNIVSKV